MRRLLTRLLGGRPMQIIRPMFVDVVSGKTIFYCIDGFGNPWMAEGRWSRFRVTPRHGPEVWDDARPASMSRHSCGGAAP